MLELWTLPLPAIIVMTLIIMMLIRASPLTPSVHVHPGEVNLLKKTTPLVLVRLNMQSRVLFTVSFENFLPLIIAFKDTAELNVHRK